MDWGDSDSEEEEADSGLMISKKDAESNCLMAGTLVDEPPDEISIAKYQHLLSDTIHLLIMEVLQEAKITFKLADFQLLSLHMLGNKRSLILISPTGNGKMLGKSSFFYTI